MRSNVSTVEQMRLHLQDLICFKAIKAIAQLLDRITGRLFFQS